MYTSVAQLRARTVLKTAMISKTRGERSLLAHCALDTCSRVLVNNHKHEREHLLTYSRSRYIPIGAANVSETLNDFVSFMYIKVRVR